MDYPFQLSVLVPCYNVERHLDVSLWCLEQQWDDDKSMEIVFVNDCSTDGTLELLQSFCKKHPENTVLINKEKNGGVAQARNDALKVARGRWIAFFDPDDAISSGAYQAMCNDYLDDNVDILSYDTNLVLNADILPLPHYKGKIVWEGDGLKFFKKYRTDVVWSFIYSHALLDKLGVTFPVVSILEGEMFNTDVFLNEGIRVRRINCKPYYYFARPDSLSSISSIDGNMEMIDGIMAALEDLEQRKQSSKDAWLVDRIAWKQTEIARRLIPLFIRTDQVDKGQIDRVREQLINWKIYPYRVLKGGFKDKLYDLFFRFPGFMVSLRPMLIKLLGR